MEKEKIEQSPFIILTNRKDRETKRKIIKEIERNGKGLLEIQVYYLKTKQIEEDKQDVFNFFNEEYKKECQRIRKQKKLIYTLPNDNFFEFLHK